MPEHNTVLTIPEPEVVKLRNKPYPTVGPGYLLIRVRIAPVCIEHQIYRDHTFEWHEDEEHLGHEGVGEVVETMPDSRFSVGDRVIVYQGNPCGECFVCERQLSPTHCLTIPYEEIRVGGNPHQNLDALDGDETMNAGGGLKAIELACGSQSGGFGFARYRLAPERMVQKIPDDLDFRYAAAANCALGCTYTGLEESGVSAGDWVMVAGIGFIGFGAIVNAKYRGAKVIALGRNEYRMRLAKRLGADCTVNPDDADWLDRVRALTGRLGGCDAVFECCGYPYYQKRALAAVRRYGTMYMFGFLVGDDTPLPVHLLDEIHNRHVTLTGGHDVRVKDRAGVVEMLRDSRVQRSIDLMVTHEFNMSDAARAFQAALSRKAGKIYLYPQEDCPPSRAG